MVVVEWGIDENLDAVVDRPFLESALSQALAGRVEGVVALGLTVTTDQGIRDLNRRHRGIDEVTDVLSFPLLEYDAPETPKPGFPFPPDEPQPLGDLAISYPRAVEQANAYGHSLQRELAYLLVHGAMHLLGYDHVKTEDAALMRQEEEAVLGRLGLSSK